MNILYRKCDKCKSLYPRKRLCGYCYLADEYGRLFDMMYNKEKAMLMPHKNMLSLMMEDDQSYKIKKT